MLEGLENVESFVSGNPDYELAKNMFQEDWGDEKNKMKIYYSPKINHPLKLTDDQLLEEKEIKNLVHKTIDDLLSEAAWKFTKINNNKKIDKRTKAVKDAYDHANRLNMFLDTNLLNFTPEGLFSYVREGIENIHSKFPNLDKTIEQREAKISSNISH